MISHEIWKKHALVGFSKAINSTRPSDSCYFEVFEKSLVRIFSKLYSKSCYYLYKMNMKCKIKFQQTVYYFCFKRH